jgi:biopolymer transport protein ExbD
MQRSIAYLRRANPINSDTTMLPMIDVVFILVIALATRVTQEQPTLVHLASLSDSAQSPIATPKNTTPIVEVASDGAMRLNGSPIAAGEALNLDRLFPVGAAQRVVLMRVDRAAKYEHVLTIREQVTRQGIDVVEEAMVQTDGN